MIAEKFEYHILDTTIDFGYIAMVAALRKINIEFPKVPSSMILCLDGTPMIEVDDHRLTLGLPCKSKDFTSEGIPWLMEEVDSLIKRIKKHVESN